MKVPLFDPLLLAFLLLAIFAVAVAPSSFVLAWGS